MDKLFKKSVEILATWFGCGKSPYAPGTVGTLGALPLVWALGHLQGIHYMIATYAVAVGGIFIAQFYEDLIAPEGAHDLPEVVIDEVAGLLVTMTWIPWSWPYVIAGFLIFRFFDILKPFPISWLDRRIPGGVGVMADDLAAGILGNIILQAILQRGWL